MQAYLVKHLDGWVGMYDTQNVIKSLFAFLLTANVLGFILSICDSSHTLPTVQCFGVWDIHSHIPTDINTYLRFILETGREEGTDSLCFQCFIPGHFCWYTHYCWSILKSFRWRLWASETELFLHRISRQNSVNSQHVVPAKVFFFPLIIVITIKTSLSLFQDHWFYCFKIVTCWLSQRF